MLHENAQDTQTLIIIECQTIINSYKQHVSDSANRRLQKFQKVLENVGA